MLTTSLTIKGTATSQGLSDQERVISSPYLRDIKLPPSMKLAPRRKFLSIR